MKFDSSAPVGVFDSGVGGLSVLQHIHQALPHEKLVYVADSSFAPYGDKTSHEILKRSIAITDFLLSQDIKAVVVACNTATAAAISHMRQLYPDLIVVGIEPGLKPAALLSKTKKVGVLATLSTIQSDKYQRLRVQLNEETGVEFFSQACVGLVEQIEKKEVDADQIRSLLQHYLPPLLNAKVDTLVLGCTHYPFVADFIHEFISAYTDDSKLIRLVDTGKAVATRLQHLLADRLLITSESGTPAITAYTGGNSETLKHAFTEWIHIPEEQLSISTFLI
ncbi:glutamate racemase [Undibacterium sp. TJN19]|uniref:glutamate racemase n=1 Tax=Undibacterium sp. TJN19 TaxID=3413055 RepID=UPI003BF3D3B6